MSNAYKNALEMQTMFLMGAQLAKSENRYEVDFSITEEELIELLQKAFPNKKNMAELENWAKDILAET